MNVMLQLQNQATVNDLSIKGIHEGKLLDADCLALQLQTQKQHLAALLHMLQHQMMLIQQSPPLPENQGRIQIFQNVLVR